MPSNRPSRNSRMLQLQSPRLPSRKSYKHHHINIHIDGHNSPRFWADEIHPQLLLQFEETHRRPNQDHIEGSQWYHRQGAQAGLKLGHPTTHQGGVGGSECDLLGHPRIFIVERMFLGSTQNGHSGRHWACWVQWNEGSTVEDRGEHQMVQHVHQVAQKDSRYLSNITNIEYQLEHFPMGLDWNTKGTKTVEELVAKISGTA